jgi:hypothetical protein
MAEQCGQQQKQCSRGYFQVIQCSSSVVDVNGLKIEQGSDDYKPLEIGGMPVLQCFKSYNAWLGISALATTFSVDRGSISNPPKINSGLNCYQAATTSPSVKPQLANVR